MSERPVTRLSSATLPALFLWLAGCAVFAYWDTLRLPFALDDLHHLHVLADMRMGKTSFLTWILLPVNEHILPLLRSFYLVGTFVGRLDATFLRVTLVLVHAAGGLACGLLVFYHCGSRLGMWAAGTMYAGLAGFAGSVIWLPANANYLLSSVAVSFALVLLCSSYGRRQWALAAAVALTVLGAGAFAGVVLVALAIPAYCVLVRPPLGAGRRTVVLTYLGLTIVILLASRGALHYYNAGYQFRPEALNVLKGFWLVYTAPFRFAAAWTPHTTQQISTIVRLSAVVWALLALSWFLLQPRERRLLACLWAGPVTLMLLIAAGRRNSLLGFFLTDRYYYFFLLPLSAHCGFLLARLRFRSGLTATILLCLLAPALAASRANLRDTVLWTIYGFHSRALRSGLTLVQIIASRAEQRSPANPLLLVDGPIPFDGVHLGTISVACLFYTEFPRGLPGVRFVPASPDAETARAQNLILDEWTEKVGAEGSPVCVEAGRLKEVRAFSWIDFRKGAFEGAIVSGFHSWEGTQRWTSSLATLRLVPVGETLAIRAYAPVQFLRNKWPGLEGVRATVQVNGAPAGAIEVTAEEREFQIPAPAALLSRNSGSPEVLVTLKTDLMWRPAEVSPTHGDERQLGLGIIAIGFRPPAGSPAGRTWNPCASRILQ